VGEDYLMRVYWWQAGLHLRPESDEEGEALKSLEKLFRCLGHHKGRPKLWGARPRRG